MNFEKMTRTLKKCDLTKQLYIYFHEQNSYLECKLMENMHKKVIPVKYQVNKYDKFSLFITVVTELFFAGRERKICLCLVFLFFYTRYKGLYSALFFHYTVLKRILKSGGLLKISCLGCLLFQ